METFKFENENLPVAIMRENIAKREIHSGIAHWHDDVELIVVNNGTIICKTGGEEFTLHAGDVCFINRRQLHQITTADGPECCHKVIIFGECMLMNNNHVYEKYIKPMLEDARFSHVRFEGEGSPAQRISEIISRAELLQNEKPIGYELDMISLIHQLGKELYLSYAEDTPKGPIDNNLLIQQKMAEYIYENYGSPLTLDDIAASGGVSRSYCSRLFNQHTGLSPIAFLNRHRLEVSLGMLRSSGKSIAEVAQECGFSDQSYFSRMFQKEYACTPKEYRKSGMPAA